jgi:DNA topoisomerase-2
MWPNLLKYNFLKEFVTPIIKVTKGDNIKSFFTIADYERWEQENSKKGFTIKYYKGLGTSTAKEAKDYFSDLLKHVITFKHSGSEKEVEDAITLAF